MRNAIKITRRREAFTLIELIVVISIILVIAALAAAFAPRVSDSQNLTRSVDQLEQWLLTAKMRAKRDQLATGLRFVQASGDPPGMFSEFQYIQQPDPLSGGWVTASAQPGSVPFGPLWLNGGICLPTSTRGQVQLFNVDCSMGQTLTPNQYLIQPGDYLEMRDGGVYFIAAATATATNPPVTIVQLSGSVYDTSLSITSPTTNYRILRQARILIGESPLQLPNNYALDTTLIPPTIIPGNTTVAWSNVQTAPNGSLEILFSPSGAVVGANSGLGKLLMTVHDMTVIPIDVTRAGIVAVQTRTGFIGAYSVAPGAGLPGFDPFLFAEIARESGL